MIDFLCSARSEVGRVRRSNEDAWATDERAGLAVVADGMGGHPAGDLASRAAIAEIMARLADGPPAAELESTPGREGEEAGEWMVEAVRSANRRILEEGNAHPERRGMGTTLTVLQVDRGDGAYRVAHVGDSRAYLFREGSLAPLTRDDTPLQDLVDSGRMSREEARVHPMSNVLSRALGTRADVEPQLLGGTALPGDLFLLCTDGLTAVLPERRIREILESEGGARPDVADRLVEETLAGGAPDNVTVVVARIREGTAEG